MNKHQNKSYKPLKSDTFCLSFFCSWKLLFDTKNRFAKCSHASYSFHYFKINRPQTSEL